MVPPNHSRCGVALVNNSVTNWRSATALLSRLFGLEMHVATPLAEGRLHRQ